jgi:hypothetical protein
MADSQEAKLGTSYVSEKAGVFLYIGKKSV